MVFWLAVALPAAYAVGLGQAELQSALGQHLAVRIGLSSPGLDDLGCISVKGREDLPPPVGLHFEVLSDARGPYLEVTSSQSVNDPAIALIVHAGCGPSISREYVLFMNPQPFNTAPPASNAATVDAASPGVPAGDAARAAREPSSGGASSATGEAVRLARRSGGDALTASRRTTPPPVALPAPRAQPAPRAPLGRGAPQSGTPLPVGAGSNATASPVERGPSDDAQRGRGDRLHLSRAQDSPDLRIAADLTLPTDGPPPDEVRLAELRLEQARLMALLNDQGVANTPTPKEIELQKQVGAISSSMAALRQQVSDAQARSQALSESRAAGMLPWILGACAVLALAIAAWFGWRYRTAQDLTADHPWWEQSQLASARPATPIRTAPAPGAAHLTGHLPYRAPLAEDDSRVSATGIETDWSDSPPAGPPPAIRAPLSGSSVTRPAATKPAAPPPSRVPFSSPPAAPAGIAAIYSPGSPLQGRTGTATSAPAAPAPAEPVSTKAADAPAPEKTVIGLPYGIGSTAVGSLDERVETTELTRSAIDFNLDLPEILATPPAAGDAASAPATPPRTAAGGSDPAARPPEPVPAPSSRPKEAFKLEPLEFELPAAQAGQRSPEPINMGPDTILRMDDPGEAGALTNSLHGAEQASLQFRLLQFAAVIDQATELRNSGEATKAIAVLRQYVLRDESIPTLMWLMLFELYRQVNKKPVYEALAEHFSRRYKRPMARWDETLEHKTAQLGLAQMPEVDKQLKARWGTSSGLEMIMGLLCDRDRTDSVVFNAVLQRDLLLQAKVFPIEDTA